MQPLCQHISCSPPTSPYQCCMARNMASAGRLQSACANACMLQSATGEAQLHYASCRKRAKAWVPKHCPFLSWLHLIGLAGDRMTFKTGCKST